MVRIRGNSDIKKIKNLPRVGVGVIVVEKIIFESIAFFLVFILFTTTEDLLYANIGVKHCFVSNKIFKKIDKSLLKDI